MDYKFISETELFAGTTQEETKIMLKCLGAEERRYPKDHTIYHMGQTVHRLGLLLEGGVNIVRTDVWGNENIIGHVLPGDVFAETYACNPEEPMMADVMTTLESRVVFLDVGKVIQTCSSSCDHHERLIRNLLVTMSVKNLNLSRKINHITPKTIRERLLSYLSWEAVRQGKMYIDIPFSRQQLADYLSVDRSALSSELSKMQKEGLLSYKKNHFILKEAKTDGMYLKMED
ncbi:CRP-like cAMP-binding protein [Muricomes intestini]|uniref:CRP-like cAMP-binding protein n=1 Tax=Muricomes intestini TaxID=1796634 RepID=A0A4R3KG47_9FIRM|nr:Crp/Fnr family transcriptional regulator [Muricomes intestini]TCS82190.1 CRP-like cAMP-binding protein [Muricomes intestini]HAX53556.1 Crp/Fnr family transcriptional regulator [Lachnospiraceae bacterium]